MGFGKKHNTYGTSSKYYVDDRDDEVSVAIRKATNKHLSRPDPALNQRVVSVINQGFSDVESSGVAKTMVMRLRSDNPHKQWLAVMLTQRVLRDCGDVLLPSKGELLQEIASIASRPIGTHIVNASAAQRAKQEAFLLLQEHGSDGQQAMQTISGAGAVNLLVNNQVDNARSYKQQQPSSGTPRAHQSGPSWSDLKTLVTTEIQVANNQTEVLQDMLRNSQSGVGNFERSFFEELTAQMVSFRYTFESNVAKLAAFETDEANRLMITAIETVEKMNTALNQYHELITTTPPPAQSAHTSSPAADNLIDFGDAVSPPPTTTPPAPLDLLGQLLADPIPTQAPDTTPAFVQPAPTAPNAFPQSSATSALGQSAPADVFGPPGFSAASAASALSAMHLSSVTAVPGTGPALPGIQTVAPVSPLASGNPFGAPAQPKSANPFASPAPRTPGGQHGLVAAHGMAPAQTWSSTTSVDILPSGLAKPDSGLQHMGPSMRQASPMAGAHATISLDRGKAAASDDVFDDLVTMRR